MLLRIRGIRVRILRRLLPTQPIVWDSQERFILEGVDPEVGRVGLGATIATMRD